MLELDNVNAYYGDSHILHDVSLSVQEGEIVCLLGRNGAGKTTTILTIMGYLQPRPGRIRYRDRDIAGLPPYEVARLGFGFVPQERGIFPSLSVRENLTVFARAEHYAENINIFTTLPFSRNRYFGGIEIALFHAPQRENPRYKHGKAPQDSIDLPKEDFDEDEPKEPLP